MIAQAFFIYDDDYRPKAKPTDPVSITLLVYIYIASSLALSNRTRPFRNGVRSAINRRLIVGPSDARLGFIVDFQSIRFSRFDSARFAFPRNEGLIRIPRRFTVKYARQGRRRLEERIPRWCAERFGVGGY